MKKIIVYTLLLILLPIAGWKIGYTGIFFSSPVRQGKWEKIFDRYNLPYKLLDNYQPLNILSVDNDSKLYIYYESLTNENEPSSIWECTFNANNCINTNQESFPLSSKVIALSHEVVLTEVPPLPITKDEVVDILKEGTRGGEALLYNYYLLQKGGAIWNWSYWDSGSELITKPLTGIVSGIIGLATAIAIIIIDLITSRGFKTWKESYDKYFLGKSF
jgi:hypothetical protein